MGDEIRGRSCPDCGERLAVDARRCACGWGARKAGKGEEGPRYDAVCRWQYGSLSCSYPVGMFQQGEYRGLCIFHRFQDKGPEAAKIAQESSGASRSDYLKAAAATLYGRGDNPAVARLRASLRPSKPGNLGALAAPAVMREPGADEREGA